MTNPFYFDSEALKDSVDVFNLIVQQKEMLGEEQVMNMIRQELVRGLSEVEDIELGDWDKGLKINGVQVMVGLCLRESDVHYTHDLVQQMGVNSFLILIQLPNEDWGAELYYPFESMEISEEWEFCHVAKGFRN